jgi:hypothetical protein
MQLFFNIHTVKRPVEGGGGCAIEGYALVIVNNFETFLCFLVQKVIFCRIYEHIHSKISPPFRDLFLKKCASFGLALAT